MSHQQPQGSHERALEWLYGARVERIDAPTHDLFALTLYIPKGRAELAPAEAPTAGSKCCLLLAVGPMQRAVGVSEQRPKGEAASAYVRRLRTKIENARLVEAHWLGGAGGQATALELVFRRNESQEHLIADFDARFPALLLLGPERRVVGASDEARVRKRLSDRAAPYAPPGGRGIARVSSREQARACGEKLASQGQASGLEAQKAQARTSLRAALKRAERKADAIRGDIERAQAAPRLRREATLLLCNLHEVKRGTEHVVLRDESVEPAEELALELDPALDAQKNAERRFERAKKLERGTLIATQRLAEVDAELARLRALLHDVDSDDHEQVASALEALGLRAQPTSQPLPRRRAEPKTHVAYRTFLGSQGRRIFVGKGAADNDTLTLTVARPHDHFLHVRGTPGAHVIIPRDKNAQVPQELLIDGAHLAAHFSEVRGERLVEIQHTERRYVRKPKGAAPGSVIVDREKVLLLRVEPERLQRLLAAEKRA